ncbi:MAG: hypothetical protein IJJ19_06750 [Erysipelotrichaceae bacterium]|nr:hypothetical protein [Erysipelotrichaceae bacterium]
MKKIFILLAIGAVLLMGCTNKENKHEEELIGGNTQIANPFVGYETLEDACKEAGFDLVLPEKVEGYDGYSVQLMNGKMIQVIYGGNELYIRKMAGDTDISGDYNSYKVNEVSDILGKEVTFRGDGEKVYNVTWLEEGYTYAIYNSEGMSPEMAFWLAEEIK